MKITFLLTNVPNPRNNKRIKAFAQFADIDVICSRRLNMDVCPLENIPGVRYHIIDIDMPPVKYLFKRALAFIKYSSFCKKELRSINSDIVYLCGLDNLMIVTSAVNKKTKICYEVADLRESYTNQYHGLTLRGFFDDLVKIVERHLSKRISLLTVTSIKFYETHYYQLFPREKVIEVPNMPNLSAFNHYKPKMDNEFIIGFVGGLRYLDQMRMLVDASGKVGIKVIFSGAILDAKNGFLDYCKDKSWVTFTGRFDFMKDIADIYGSIDCVYSVYDASNFNVRNALPNKLYEAVVAEIPIIVANNTYLGELVNEWGTGVSINYDNEKELIEVLSKLKSKDEFYHGFVQNCKKKKAYIDVSMYINELCNKVKHLANEKL